MCARWAIACRVVLARCSVPGSRARNGTIRPAAETAERRSIVEWYRSQCARVAERRGAARHRRHGVIATSIGSVPTAMSVGCLVRVFTSVIDTDSLRLLVTKAVLPSGVTAGAPAPA
jgi:hypothetical protein